MKAISILLLLSCLALRLNAQSINLASNVFELNTTERESKFSIALNIQGVEYTKIVLPTVIGLTVKLGKRTDSIFSTAVRILKNEHFHVLDVTVANALLPYAGTYEVMVQYSVPGKESQWLNFSIIRPPATLQSLNTVNIIDEEGRLLQKDEIALRETSNKGGVSSLYLSPPYLGKSGSNNFISISNKPLAILPGKDLIIPYTIDRDSIRKYLPLGETKGTLRVYSEQMSASVDVPFTVIRKKNNAWIIAAVFSGLLFGLFVKHFLNYKKEWEAAKFHAQQLIQQISSSTILIKDFEYGRAISELIVLINSALDPSSSLNPTEAVTRLEELVSIAKTNYETIRQNLKVRLEEQKRLIVMLEEVFSPGFLHPVVERQILPLKSILESAVNFYQSSDAAGSAKTVGTLLNAGNQLLSELRSYTKSIVDLLDDTNIYPNLMLPDFPPAIQTKTTSIVTALDMVMLPATPEGFPAILLELNRLYLSVEKLIAHINEQVHATYQKADPAAAKNSKFTKVYSDWTAPFNRIIDNERGESYAEVYWQDEAVKSFNELWTELTAQQREDIKSFTVNDQKKWATAFQDPSAADSHNFIFKSSISDTVIPQIADLPKAIDKSRSNWFFIAAIQSLILAVLMSGAAYISYADTFKGTWQEITGLFLFAFSLDITVDNIAKLKEKIK